MRLSAAGRDLIKRLEGLRLTAYPDGNIDGRQLYSIGYGHNGVARGSAITQAEADRLFDQDVARFERCVEETVTLASPRQFDAMVSLAYNIGTSPMQGFPSSTVARLHNAGDYSGAAAAFRMWNKSGGSINPVLIARRETELAFYGGTSSPAPAPASSLPIARAPSSGSGMLIAGVGLLFFCPSCGAAVAKLEVMPDANGKT